MKKDTLWAFTRCSFTLALLVAICVLFTNKAEAAILPVGPEQDPWSDLALPGGVTGSYDSGTLDLVVSVGPTGADLEIGDEFGPSNPGTHYGPFGTLGGSFGATLTVSGAQVDSSGTVTSAGTVTVLYNGSPVLSIGEDYGIGNGGSLLTGTVLEVLLDATGDNTLDVLWQVTGGALQAGTNSEATLAGVPFAPDGLGLLRFAGGGISLPSVWNTNFSLDGATLNVHGLPEPGSMALILLGAVFAATGRSKQK